MRVNLCQDGRRRNGQRHVHRRVPLLEARRGSWVGFRLGMRLGRHIIIWEGLGLGGGMGGMGGGGVSFSAGFGFFPSLFGLQFQTFTPPAPVSMGGGGSGGGGGSAAMTADEAQQAFLSKLLLMLGIFTLGVLVFC